MENAKEKILELAESLDADTQAELAGRLLSKATLSTNTFERFSEQLDPDDLTDLTERLNDAAGESDEPEEDPA